MKRFLSIILALTLIMSLMPTMFASAEDTGVVTYRLSRSEVDLTNKEEWTGTFGTWSIQNLISYGDHGFKFWTADANTEAEAPKVAQILQLMGDSTSESGVFTAGALRLYAGNKVDPTEGVKLVLALKKPENAGFYTMSICSSKNNTATVAEFFASDLDENNKNVDFYISNVTKNGSVYKIPNGATVLLPEAVCVGEKDLAVGMYTGPSKNMQLEKVVLTPIPVRGITLSVDNDSCYPNETRKLSVTATYKNASNKDTTIGVVDSFVTYQSSDDTIATVAEDGTITGHKNGTVTITAKAGGFSSSIKFEVGAVTYKIEKPATLAADYWNSAIATGNMKECIVPLIGYGDHGFKYWDADDASVENQVKNVRALHFSSCLRVWSVGTQTGYEFTNPNGAKAALALETPKKGFYAVEHKSGSSDGQVKKLDIYMTEISAADEAAEERAQVETFVVAKNLVKTGASGNTGWHTYNKAIAISGESNLIWAASVDPESNFSVSRIQLIELPVSAITLVADAEEIALDGETNVNAYAGEKALAHSFVTYESLNPEIAKVSDTGVVTAVAPGKATIKATALDYTATATVTVAEPEPEEPGKELTETVTFGVDNSRSLSYLREFITAPGYTVGSPAQVAVGTKVTLTAKDADEEGFMFRFWKVSGRFYSTEKQITLTIARNTSVIAVYDDVFFTTAKYVEFWNGDKDFISEEITLAETLDAKYFPKDPKMTGMRFIGWYLDDETPFTPETVIKNGYTRVAAKYEPLGTEYTVKVNGEENKGKYNSPVSVSAPEAFTYWKLGEEKLSFRRAFEFFNYGNAELISVVDEEAKAIPTVVIDKNLGAAFITYDTPAGYERIETGIIFGNSAAIDVNIAYSKASAMNTAAFGQFTAKPMAGETYARGYQIFKKDGIIRVIYTEAIEV